MNMKIETKRLILRSFTEETAAGEINIDQFDVTVPRVVLAVELKSTGKCV